MARRNPARHDILWFGVKEKNMKNKNILRRAPERPEEADNNKSRGGAAR